MNCSACGNVITPGARFCSACGTRLAFEPNLHTRYIRPREGRMIAGVCAGIALRHGWDVSLVRLVVALAVLFAGLPVVAYLIAWIVMPNGDYSLPVTTGVSVS